MVKHQFFEVFPELKGAGLPRLFGVAEILSIVVDKTKTGLDVTIELPEALTPDEKRDAERKICAKLGFKRVSLTMALQNGDASATVAPAAPQKPAPVPEKPKTAPKPKPKAPAKPGEKPKNVLFGKNPTGSVTALGELDVTFGSVTIEGDVFIIDNIVRQRGKPILRFGVTDYTGSIFVKMFPPGDDNRGGERADRELAEFEKLSRSVKKGLRLRINGKVIADHFENNDIVIRPQNIAVVPSAEKRHDNAPVKRVELHLHTRMSAMDALCDTDAVIKRARDWGHPAIGITDHGVVQSFPDASHTLDGKGMENTRVLYGVEGYYLNDIDARPGMFGELASSSNAEKVGFLDDEIVVFDLETTGLSSYNDRITELAAVTMRGGEVLSEFHTYVNPGMSIPYNITELTGISNETVADAPPPEEAVRAFLDYVGGRTMAAHNASFDIGFIYEECWRAGIPFEPSCLDTLALARAFFPTLYNHKLPTVSEELKLPKFDHHHALADAKTTGFICAEFVKRLQEKGCETAADINAFVRSVPTKYKQRTNHIIIYVTKQEALKDFYRIVTDSHLEHFSKNPVIPKSLLMKHRDGLMIGSACEAGEIFNAIERGSRYDRHRLAAFYDYLEIQPICNNWFMLNTDKRGSKPRARTEEDLRDFNRAIIQLGRETGKPVVATGDVHFIDPEDEVYRAILLNAKGFDDALDPHPLYLRTTEEMLDEFAYLGEELAYEVVVTNTNKIADMIGNVQPLPPKKTLFTPKIENSAEDLKSLVYSKLRELYGDNPPELITSRLEVELTDILAANYDIIYIAAQRVVKDSLDHGYLVGSRGSVGSSIVAYLSGITEVNSLPAHYRCPKCHRTDFESGHGFGCGADMPEAVCPDCGTQYAKEGFDIPFETFLGFGGDKVPDIDLNFSGEYQANAHRYTNELFGSQHVFRAGTIGTVAEKTAFGYVKKYLEAQGRTVSRAEEARLAQGCVGVKRTTGQHPGGLVVIPQGMDITDFCPAQYPADKDEAKIITTHFEYHCMEDNLLKLDELGHDDPTMIKMLEDMTGINAVGIPLDDPQTMKIFSSPEPLGAPSGDKIIGFTGTIGIPEFGTSFTREMLHDTQPTQFDTLVRLSGFSHGTDVWLGNAKDIIMNKIADISETIGCRDDIMLYLISLGMDAKRAFKIMEAIRKGRGLPDGAEDEMIKLGVPDWYIKSCQKIKYLFPKAHAVAYVTMAFRIAWYKVHRPLAFYSAYFYRRSQKDSFDARLMTRGQTVVDAKIREINGLRIRSAKETDLLTTLEACHEFYARGYTFLPLDLYASDAVKFEIVGDNALRAPFVSIAGLGEIAAREIAIAREGRSFVAIDDFVQVCSKVSKSHIDALTSLGAFGDMPETSQMTLF